METNNQTPPPPLPATKHRPHTRISESPVSPQVPKPKSVPPQFPQKMNTIHRKNSNKSHLHQSQNILVKLYKQKRYSPFSQPRASFTVNLQHRQKLLQKIDQKKTSINEDVITSHEILDEEETSRSPDETETPTTSVSIIAPNNPLTSVPSFTERKSIFIDNQTRLAPTSSRSTYCLAFSPCGRYTATANASHFITIINNCTGKIEHYLRGHSRSPWTLCWNKKWPALLASACLNGEVKIWNVWRKEAKELKDIKCSQNVRICIDFHPSEQILLIAQKGVVCFWNWGQSEVGNSCLKKVKLGMKWTTMYCRFNTTGTGFYTAVDTQPTLPTSASRIPSVLLNQMRRRQHHQGLLPPTGPPSQPPGPPGGLNPRLPRSRGNNSDNTPSSTGTSSRPQRRAAVIANKNIGGTKNTSTSKDNKNADSSASQTTSTSTPPAGRGALRRAMVPAWRGDRAESSSHSNPNMGTLRNQSRQRIVDRQRGIQSLTRGQELLRQYQTMALDQMQTHVNMSRDNYIPRNNNSENGSASPTAGGGPSSPNPTRGGGTATTSSRAGDVTGAPLANALGGLPSQTPSANIRSPSGMVQSAQIGKKSSVHLYFVKICSGKKNVRRRRNSNSRPSKRVKNMHFSSDADFDDTLFETDIFESASPTPLQVVKQLSSSRKRSRRDRNDSSQNTLEPNSNLKSYLITTNVKILNQHAVDISKDGRLIVCLTSDISPDHQCSIYDPNLAIQPGPFQTSTSHNNVGHVDHVYQNNSTGGIFPLAQGGTALVWDNGPSRNVNLPILSENRNLNMSGNPNETVCKIFSTTRKQGEYPLLYQIKCTQTVSVSLSSSSAFLALGTACKYVKHSHEFQPGMNESSNRSVIYGQVFHLDHLNRKATHAKYIYNTHEKLEDREAQAGNLDPVLQAHRVSGPRRQYLPNCLAFIPSDKVHGIVIGLSNGSVVLSRPGYDEIELEKLQKYPKNLPLPYVSTVKELNHFKDFLKQQTVEELLNQSLFDPTNPFQVRVPFGVQNLSFPTEMMIPSTINAINNTRNSTQLGGVNPAPTTVIANRYVRTALNEGVRLTLNSQQQALEQLRRNITRTRNLTQQTNSVSGEGNTNDNRQGQTSQHMTSMQRILDSARHTVQVLSQVSTNLTQVDQQLRNFLSTSQLTQQQVHNHAVSGPDSISANGSANQSSSSRRPILISNTSVRDTTISSGNVVRTTPFHRQELESISSTVQTIRNQQQQIEAARNSISRSLAAGNDSNLSGRDVQNENRTGRIRTRGQRRRAQQSIISPIDDVQRHLELTSQQNNNLTTLLELDILNQRSSEIADYQPTTAPQIAEETVVNQEPVSAPTSSESQTETATATTVSEEATETTTPSNTASNQNTTASRRATNNRRGASTSSQRSTTETNNSESRTNADGKEGPRRSKRIKKEK